MAVTAGIYPLGLFVPAFNEEHDLLDDTIKCALTTSTHTINQDTHNYYNDLTNEVTGTNYVAGGATLANDTLTYTAGTNTLTYDADDVTWAISTITNAAQAHYYNSTGGGTDATRALISYLDFGENKSSSGGTFQITHHANGIFSITC